MTKTTKFVAGAVALVGVLTLAGCRGDDSGAAELDAADRTDTGEAAVITGSGVGRVEGTPDTMTVDIGVTTRGASAAEAMQQNAAAADRVFDALRDAGVEDEDLQTNDLSVFPVFDDRSEQVIEYEVSNSVTATFHDIERSGEVIDAAAAVAGDDIRLYGVTFSIEDTSQLVAAARADAVERARSQAEQLGDAAGVEIGGVISIEELSPDVGEPVFVEAAAAEDAARASTPVNPGTQELSVQVSVRYAIA
jgi:hypothetical protein